MNMVTDMDIRRLQAKGPDIRAQPIVALVSATGDRRGNVAFEVTLPPAGSEISLAERKCS